MEGVCHMCGGVELSVAIGRRNLMLLQQTTREQERKVGEKKVEKRRRQDIEIGTHTAKHSVPTQRSQQMKMRSVNAGAGAGAGVTMGHGDNSLLLSSAGPHVHYLPSSTRMGVFCGSNTTCGRENSRKP